VRFVEIRLIKKPLAGACLSGNRIPLSTKENVIITASKGKHVHKGRGVILNTLIKGNAIDEDIDGAGAGIVDNHEKNSR
jgi:hypothetical protein